MRPKRFQVGLDPTTADLRRVADYLMEMHIIMPRLLQRVRSCMQNQAENTLAFKTLILARYIYDPCHVPLLKKVLGKTTTIVATTDPQWKELVPVSTHFDTVASFRTNMQFCILRLQICAVMQRLMDVGVAKSTDFNREAMETEDLKAANAIVMATQYAFDPKFDPPLCALRLLKPMCLAYGSWQRLQSRECPMGNTYKRAAAMMDLCARGVSDIHSKWHGNQPWAVDPNVLAATSAAFVGHGNGPIRWMSTLRETLPGNSGDQGALGGGARAIVTGCS